MDVILRPWNKADPGVVLGQTSGVAQQAHPVQQAFQVVARQHALNHVGAVQAINAVDTKHSTLPLGEAPALHIEAKALKVAPDLIPQQAQPARKFP